MTVHIGEAIAALGIQGFYLEENPTNEEEFNKWFKKAVGVDPVSESAIMSSDPSTFGVTWDQIKVIAEDKMNDLNAFKIESAMSMVAGTARSMGIRVKGSMPKN